VLEDKLMRIRWNLLGLSAASRVCIDPTFRGPSRPPLSGIWYQISDPWSWLLTSV